MIGDEEDTDEHAAGGGAQAGTEEQLRRMYGWMLNRGEKTEEGR